MIKFIIMYILISITLVILYYCHICSCYKKECTSIKFDCWFEYNDYLDKSLALFFIWPVLLPCILLNRCFYYLLYIIRKRFGIND
jgi:hypothetical protein